MLKSFFTLNDLVGFFLCVVWMFLGPSGVSLLQQELKVVLLPLVSDQGSVMGSVMWAALGKLAGGLACSAFLSSCLSAWSPRCLWCLAKRPLVSDGHSGRLGKVGNKLGYFFFLSRMFSMSPLPSRHWSEKGRGELRKEEVGVELCVLYCKVIF
jgi:hypothetical protein